MSSAKIIENPEVPGELVGSGTNASLPLDSFRRFAITCACVCDTTEHKNVGVTKKKRSKKKSAPGRDEIIRGIFCRSTRCASREIDKCGADLIRHQLERTRYETAIMIRRTIR